MFACQTSTWKKRLRLIGSAFLLTHWAKTSFQNQTFVSGVSVFSARHHLRPSIVRCSEPLAIPTVLSSRTQPLEWKLRQLLNLSDGAPLQLAYIGTAGTAPRKDSDRPLKDQRKKRRYEARAQCRLLGEMFSASSARHIFLEDHHQDRGGGLESSPSVGSCFLSQKLRSFKGSEFKDVHARPGQVDHGFDVCPGYRWQRIALCRWRQYILASLYKTRH